MSKGHITEEEDRHLLSSSGEARNFYWGGQEPISPKPGGRAEGLGRLHACTEKFRRAARARCAIPSPPPSLLDTRLSSSPNTAFGGGRVVEKFVPADLPPYVVFLFKNNVSVFIYDVHTVTLMHIAVRVW